jgi:hypothetical protein
MRQKLARQKGTTKRHTPLRRALLYRGIFTRVARRLGKSISHVRRVALGERTSRPVLDALMEEILRIEKAAA